MSGIVTGLAPSPWSFSFTLILRNPPGSALCIASQKKANHGLHGSKDDCLSKVLNLVSLVWYSGRGYAASTANHRAFAHVGGSRPGPGIPPDHIHPSADYQ